MRFFRVRRMGPVKLPAMTLPLGPRHGGYSRNDVGIQVGTHSTKPCERVQGLRVRLTQPVRQTYPSAGSGEGQSTDSVVCVHTGYCLLTARMGPAPVPPEA